VKSEGIFDGREVRSGGCHSKGGGTTRDETGHLFRRSAKKKAKDITRRGIKLGRKCAKGECEFGEKEGRVEREEYRLILVQDGREVKQSYH